MAADSEDSGGGPMAWLRNSISNSFGRFAAHPFQGIASIAAGAAGGPLAGKASQMAFDRMNNNSFNNARDQSTEDVTDIGQQAQDDAFDKPLNGPLGEFSGSGSDTSGIDAALTGGYTPSGSDLQLTGGLNYNQGNQVNFSPSPGQAQESYASQGYSGPLGDIDPSNAVPDFSNYGNAYSDDLTSGAGAGGIGTYDEYNNFQAD